MTSLAQFDRFALARRQMVEDQLRARGIRDERVLKAMGSVPRHEFVEDRLRDQAYEDRPLPIGQSQTISQPYIVALMLEGLNVAPGNKVLEVGAGSGYVAALLGQLATQVFAVERHAVLAAEARTTIARLGYNNIELLAGDGSRGLPQHAPFDAILVSAAAQELPSGLVSQLAEGGRMVVPVGQPESQRLVLIRMQDGEPIVSFHEACRFVPLIPDNPR